MHTGLAFLGLVLGIRGDAAVLAKPGGIGRPPPLVEHTRTGSPCSVIAYLSAR
ncbi:hypothetical protein [Streptomyces heilongjiangensis]|uniref:Uncharacterized protein n=1 Tax=Streptomyces heilongjiangensis TaxID=945052 RepID=A0ABW1BKF6_9ACTN|nr:hypothetical protein [Streptomyces heilongjiangensis]MDC2952324.1 hypothetical protein [Streptomyces heilongjiangensis]